MADEVDVRAFYRDVLDALGGLARRGGTATGAAAVVKRVAIEHGVEGADRLPLPRLTRADLDDLGKSGATWRRAHGIR